MMETESNVREALQNRELISFLSTQSAKGQHQKSLNEFSMTLVLTDVIGAFYRAIKRELYRIV